MALEYLGQLDRTLRFSSEAIHMVVDATELEGFEEGVRRTLARHQEGLKGRLQRSVYLADSARVRGICLWLVRIAGDDSAIVTANPREVDGWLAGDEGRLQRAMDRLTAHLQSIGRGDK